MNIVQVEDYEEMSEKASQLITKKVNQIKRPVLGLATGSTPIGTYKRLIEKYNKGEISFKDTIAFNLDEYVGLEKKHLNSFFYYLSKKLFNHIDILDKHIYLPNGNVEDLQKECLEYERSIQKFGQIDLQILGIGINGHIGFNEPGTKFNSRTHVVELNESTRKANSKFFKSKNEVPTHAITMGIETIIESKEILLLISGIDKAEITRNIIEGSVDEQIPASILQEHDNVTIIADDRALSKLM